MRREKGISKEKKKKAEFIVTSVKSTQRKRSSGFFNSAFDGVDVDVDAQNQILFVDFSHYFRQNLLYEANRSK